MSVTSTHRKLHFDWYKGGTTNDLERRNGRLLKSVALEANYVKIVEVGPILYAMNK